MPGRYVCPACGWSQVARPEYGWQPHDDRAVEVHKQQLCRAAAAAPAYQPCNHECRGCPTCDPGLAEVE